MTSQNELKVEVRRVDELDAETLDRWRGLEATALVPNAYLSPDFVLPAVRHLCPSPGPLIVTVDAGESRPTLAAVGVFEAKTTSLRNPFNHVRGYSSPHSFLDGFLLDRQLARDAAPSLLAALRDVSPAVRSVELGACAIDLGPESELTASLRRSGIEWFESGSRERSVLVPADCGEEYLEKVLSRKKLKKLRRRERQLSEMGELEWRFVGGDGVGERHVRRFLELEHMGWKGEEGTSLLSNVADTRFFEEMMTGFAERGDAFFTELALGGEVISSTSNLISGNAGFAFKVGWDPQYAKFGPGNLNEIGMVREANLRLAGIDYIDSGAEPGSYIDELWLGRRRLASGVLTLDPMARLFTRSIEMARSLKQRIPGADRSG